MVVVVVEVVVVVLYCSLSLCRHRLLHRAVDAGAGYACLRCGRRQPWRPRLQREITSFPVAFTRVTRSAAHHSAQQQLVV